MSAFDDMIRREEQFGAGKEPGEQRTMTWLAERLGHCTASRFKDVMDSLKNGNEGAKRATYRMEVLSERVTGKPTEHYMNALMQWGVEQEEYARMAYESRTGAIISQPGFLHHPEIEWCGGSPDGTIDDDGLIEIKCPSTSTHIKTLLGAECEHLPQIQGYLWITGRKWCDFISYDPRMPERLQLFVQRIDRNELFIEALAAEVKKFLSEVAAMQSKLAEIKGV